MGPRVRIGRVWKAALLVAVGAAGGATALAVAAIPDSNGVIHGCVELANGVPITTTANLRIIDPNANQSCTTSLPGGGPPPEAALNWNQSGPPGQPGVTGATGPQGPPGAPGKSVTVSAGGTLTLPGGAVLNVGPSSGVTVTLPPLRKLVPSQTGVTLLGNGPPLHFELLSLAFANHQGSIGSPTGGGGQAGKATVHEITIVKLHDKASPTLFKAWVNGEHWSSATIVLGKHGKQSVYKLTTVRALAIQVGGPAEQPTDTLTLSFATLQISH